MNRKITSDNPSRSGTPLVVLAVLASAMMVFFMLHAGTDDSFAAQSESGSCGPDAHYDYSDGILEVSGNGCTYDYGGTVCSPWFDYRSEITKIVIGDGITALGASTFAGCGNVTELTMPISLNTVGSDMSPAFADCSRIEKIDLTYGTDGYGPDYDAYPANNKWYQNTPWYGSRDSLKELNFADGIKGIGSDTFRELNLTSLAIPDSVVALGNHAFYNCGELTDLTYPVSLRPFCDEKYPSFEGCTAINKVTITRGNGVPFDYSRPWWFWDGNCHLAPWNTNSGVAKSIVLSDDLSKLGKNIFFGCNIKEIFFHGKYFLPPEHFSPYW